MRARRNISIVGIVGASLLGAVCAQSYAWWVTTRFEPDRTSVEGIGIAELDPSWIAATVLTDAILPEEASEPGRRIEDYGGTFEVLQDLDADGLLEKAIVGVYRDRPQEVGRFLLILETDGNSWSTESLFKQPGEAGFSVLLDDDGRLQWWFCLKCDSMCAVVPNTSRFDLECHRTAAPTRVIVDAAAQQVAAPDGGHGILFISN